MVAGAFKNLAAKEPLDAGAHGVEFGGVLPVDVELDRVFDEGVFNTGLAIVVVFGLLQVLGLQQGLALADLEREQQLVEQGLDDAGEAQFELFFEFFKLGPLRAAGFDLALGNGLFGRVNHAGGVLQLAHFKGPLA